MLHGIDYPGDRPGLEDVMRVRLWHAVMRDGIIEFPLPEECTMIREIRRAEMKTFTLGKNMSSIEELFREVNEDELERRAVSDI